MSYTMTHLRGPSTQPQGTKGLQMLSGLVKIGAYAFVFTAIGTVGQSFGFGADSSPGATRLAAGRMATVLEKVPGTSKLSGIGIPGAEQATFHNASNVVDR